MILAGRAYRIRIGTMSATFDVFEPMGINYGGDKKGNR